jgi:hypothetical protein
MSQVLQMILRWRQQDHPRSRELARGMNCRCLLAAMQRYSWNFFLLLRCLGSRILSALFQLPASAFASRLILILKALPQPFSPSALETWIFDLKMKAARTSARARPRSEVPSSILRQTKASCATIQGTVCISANRINQRAHPCRFGRTIPSSHGRSGSSASLPIQSAASANRSSPCPSPRFAQSHSAAMSSGVDPKSAL